MRAAITYEMHIFKDVENTSWARPQVHSFQLSENAATSIIRNKGGLSHLRRCSPEQLSFLQSHLATQNLGLRDVREAEKKAQKVTEARRRKEAQEQEEKRAEETRKWQLEKEMASKKDDHDQKPHQDKLVEENEEDSQTCNLVPPPPPPPPMPYSPSGGLQPRGRKISAPVYISPEYSSIPPPPPPPPPGIYDYRPSPRPRRRHREKHTSLQQESDWSLESVDLDLIPVVAKLKVKQLKTTTLGLERADTGYYDYRRRKGNKMPRVSYQLAGSAKVEFAVVYSRTVMTAVPETRAGGIAHYRTESEEDGDSAYEFDSEDDMDEVALGKEEGDEEEEEEEEEEDDDLEVIEA